MGKVKVSNFIENKFLKDVSIPYGKGKVISGAYVGGKIMYQFPMGKVK